MRIIAGKYRKINIQTIESDSTRPTKDNVKEALFNVLSNYIYYEDVKVLDLFAGSGALGIETLSRGSECVDFVDKNSQCIDIIKKNISNLKGLDTSGIKYFKKDAYSFLEYATANNFKYNLIFLDPPYAFDFCTLLDDILNKFDILDDDYSLVVYETDDNEKIQKTIELVDSKDKEDNVFEYSILKIKKYGRVNLVYILKRRN